MKLKNGDNRKIVCDVTLESNKQTNTKDQGHLFVFVLQDLKVKLSLMITDQEQRHLCSSTCYL